MWFPVDGDAGPVVSDDFYGGGVDAGVSLCKVGCNN
jgi:hypothetical protein